MKINKINYTEGDCTRRATFFDIISGLYRSLYIRFWLFFKLSIPHKYFPLFKRKFGSVGYWFWSKTILPFIKSYEIKKHGVCVWYRMVHIRKIRNERVSAKMREIREADVEYIMTESSLSKDAILKYIDME